ncbi:MAG TPA: OmpA family protein [Arachidicoccus sp.]|nr:OmpA family protein [Arachidicoccus sp.]
MDSKILNYAKELLNGSFTEQASGKLGENAGAIKTALSAVIPTIFGGIAQKVSNEPSFLSTLISEAKNIFSNHSLTDLSGFVGGDAKNAEGTQSGSFLFDVFGGGFHGIIEKVAAFAGIKNESARKLFDTAQIGALGSIGKNLAEDGGDENSIGEFLSQHKAAFLSAIPATLGFGSLLSGVHAAPKAAVPHTEAAHSDAGYHQEVHRDGSKGDKRFFVPLILTIIGLGLLIWLFRGCWGNEKVHDNIVGAHEDTTATVSAPVADVSTGVLDTVSGNYIYNTGNLITIKLPNNTNIEGVGENSTENKLFRFLNDAGAVVDTADKTKGWISFDRLYFKTSSSDLTDDSKKQLNNISLILKAFPNAAIKLGGYTDNSGNAEANLQLSSKRANAAQAQLVRDGIDKSRVAAEGYGQEHPLASNDTPEGKAQNRRIDLRVTKK